MHAQCDLRLLDDGAWERCTLFDINYRPKRMTVDELREGFHRLAVQLYRRVVRRDFHLLALVLPRLAEAAKQAGDDETFDDSLRELLQNGIGNRSEIAYAAIVSGYYDDPVILECVRELLSTDSDLRDLTSALLPPGTEPTS